MIPAGHELLFSAGETLLKISEHWFRTIPTDPRAVALFQRHYSCRPDRKFGSGQPQQFIGPGECIVLLLADADGLFCWRREKYRRDSQTGVCCTVFRNESALRSSALIQEAMAAAWEKWPRERLFTFVAPGKIRSSNPGFCFKKAGWRQCGTTAIHNHVILEYRRDRIDFQDSAL